MNGSRQGRSPADLVVLGGLCLLLALPLAYLGREVFSASGFADNAVRSLDEPAVRTELSNDLTQALVVRDPELVSVEPVAKGLISDLLDTAPFEGLVRVAAEQTHSAIFSSSQDSIVIDAANLAVAVIGFIDRSNPQAAARSADSRDFVLKLANRTLTVKLMDLARTVRLLAFVLPLIALVLFGVALATARDRRRTALAIGTTLVTVGAASLAAYLVGRTIFMLQLSPGERAVSGGVFDAFFSRFPVLAFSVGLAGAIIAGAAVSITSRTRAARVPHEVLWEKLTHRPDTSREALLRATVLLALAVVIFIDPLFVLRVLVILLGAWLAYSAVLILLGLLVVSDKNDYELEPGTGRRFVRFSLMCVGALALLAGATTVAAHQFSNSGSAISDSPGCNGAIELCSKRFDNVVFPSSHNSMAAAQAGFLNANQGLDIVNQLDRGVRGLLIDAYEGRRNQKGIVRTDLADKAVKSVTATLGAEGLSAVQRLAGSVVFGPVQGDKRLYLCHVVCELGATDAIAEFQRIRDWMDRNPREVLILMIEDAAPADVVKQALADGGLEELASDFDPRSGEPFPTLKTMLDSGKRLWVMAEYNGIPGDYYRPAFEVTQETPYRFSKPSDLRLDSSCRPGRGPGDAPLFLINNWVDSYPPNPENAAIVNRKSFLVDRARRCGKLRGIGANLLAVDFVDRGDVFGAARELNLRAGPGGTPAGN